MSPLDKVLAITERLRDEVDSLSFSAPVTHVYNPLRYAWAPHQAYLSRYGHQVGRVLFLGMNPGPWGMAQTGVPFGEIAAARDWMGVEAPVGSPVHPHPKRPVQGFACPRSEVSGRRLWGWAQSTFGTAEEFFERFFVVNYCPLAFMEASGRNRTPDKLPTAERAPLFDACDRALIDLVRTLKPSRVVGVGGFAEKRARRTLAGLDLTFGRVLHPSPASPAANRGWAEQATAQLHAMGLL